MRLPAINMIIILIIQYVESDEPCTREASSNITISSVPEDISTECETITLSPNNMSTLSSQSFSRFENMEYLYLTNGDISWISPDAFLNTSLQVLRLQNNVLESIPDLLVS